MTEHGVPVSGAEMSRLLARLQAELAHLGVKSWLQPSGRCLGVWVGLYVGVSADGTRYGWNCSRVPSEIATFPVSDVESAAKQIVWRYEELRGIRRRRV